MVTRAAALRININTDGRPLDQETWRTSSKLCAQLAHCLLCPPLSPPSDLVQGVAMSTTAFMNFRNFAQTPLFSVSPSSFSLSPI